MPGSIADTGGGKNLDTTQLPLLTLPQVIQRPLGAVHISVRLYQMILSNELWDDDFYFFVIPIGALSRGEGSDLINGRYVS